MKTLTLTLVLLTITTGCSLAIARKQRIGPNPDQEVSVGTPRSEVERRLGKPITIQKVDDGNVAAVYEYTARVTAIGNLPSRGDFWPVRSPGLTEVIFG